METPSKKIYARLSFDQAQDELLAEPQTEAFRCIARPHGSRNCECHVEIEQLVHARAVMRSFTNEPTVRSVRDFINCLLCEEHSQCLRYLKHIEGEWGKRFEDGFFDHRRHSSPYSLKRGRTTSLRAVSPNSPNSPNSLDAFSHDVLTPSRENDRIPRSHLTPDDTRPGRPCRTFSASEHANCTMEGTVDPDANLGQFDNKDCVVSNHSTAAGTEGQTGETAMPRNTALVDNNGSPVAIRISEDLATSRGGKPRQQLGKSHDDDRFRPGIAHSWAPWTIRSRVIELLQEQVPGPKTRARVYATGVCIGTHQRYVKIGYTTRESIRKRIEEISNAHGVELDRDNFHFTLWMPVMQAMRLEALVHADLAFFQRNLRVVRQRKVAHHIEYFEISLDEARETVNMWVKIMEGCGMKPGKDIDATTTEKVRRCSEIFERPEPGDLNTERERWSRLNGDHKHRRDIWNTLRGKDRTAAKKRREILCDLAFIFSQAVSVLAPFLLAYKFLPNEWLLVGILAAVWTLACVAYLQIPGLAEACSSLLQTLRLGQQVELPKG